MAKYGTVNLQITADSMCWVLSLSLSVYVLRYRRAWSNAHHHLHCWTAQVCWSTWNHDFWKWRTIWSGVYFKSHRRWTRSKVSLSSSHCIKLEYVCNLLTNVHIESWSRVTSYSLLTYLFTYFLYTMILYNTNHRGILRCWGSVNGSLCRI